jgi:chromosome segregation ATPase
MDTKQLKDFIAAGGRQFKIFKEAEEALAKLEGIEQTIRETEKRMAEYRAGEEELAAKHRDGLAIIDANRIEAQGILKAANEEAAKIVAEGIAKLDAKRETMAKERADADNELAEVMSKAQAAAKALNEIEDGIAEAAAALRELQDKKAEILKAFG